MKIFAFAAVLCLCFAGAGFAQNSSAPVIEGQSVAKLPDDVLILVEAHGLGNMQEHLKGYVAAVSPAIQCPDLMSKTLAPFAERVNRALLDDTQPERIFVLKGPEGKLATVMQFSSTDAVTFVSSLAAGLTKGEEKDGVTSYRDEKPRTGATYGGTASPKSVAIGFDGRTVCFGQGAESVRKILALVRSGIINPQPFLEGGDIAATVRAAALVNHLETAKDGTPGRRLFERLPQKRHRLHTATTGVREAFREESEAATESVLKQVDRLSAWASLDEKEMKVEFSIVPAQGSKLREYLETMQPGLPSALKHIPDDAFAVVALKLGKLDMYATPFRNFVASFWKRIGKDQQEADRLASEAAQLCALCGDNFGFAWRTGGGMRMVQALNVRDVPGFRQFVQNMPEILSASVRIHEDLGLKVKLEPELDSYKGNDITRWKFAFAVESEDSKETKSSSIDALDGVKVTFGKKAVMESAVLGSDWVSTFGGDSLDTLKRVIDGDQKTLADIELLKKAGPDVSGLVLIHAPELVEWQLGLLRALTPQRYEHVIPQPQFRRGPGMSILIRNGKGGDWMNAELRLPAEELKILFEGMRSKQTESAK